MRFLKNLETMGKNKKSFDNLSNNNNVKEIEKDEMKNILGGRKEATKAKKWLHFFSNIMPQ